jgi:hypothetical protein
MPLPTVFKGSTCRQITNLEVGSELSSTSYYTAPSFLEGAQATLPTLLPPLLLLIFYSDEIKFK